MRSKIRVSLVMLVMCSAVAVMASAAQAAPFEVTRFVATNCKFSHVKCGSEETAGPFGPYIRPKAKISVPEAEAEGFTQAGGRVPFGVTHFEVAHTGEYPNAVPNGTVNHVRVDVATSLATSPAAVPMCSMAEFGETEVPVPGTGLYPAPTCKPETEIGTEQVTVDLGKEAGEALGARDLPISGIVYNLPQPVGLASLYGVALAFPKFLTEAKGLGATQFYVHGFVKGNVEWGKEAAGTGVGDYHDYFEVEVSPALPLLSSRQVLFGTSPNGATSAGTGNFITNGTLCPGDHTTFVTLKDTANETTRGSFETPLALEKCALVPFVPEFSLTPATPQQDQPDGITTSFGVPHVTGKEIDSSQVKSATVTLPEGMTLNPSAASGLTACTPAQARINSPTPGVSCPVNSKVGTATLEVPTLPGAGSPSGTAFTTGNVYLGAPESGTITGPPYTMYVVAESPRYGVYVRVKGTVTPDLATGRVTASFTENPEQPFTNLTLHINGGPFSPIANPLGCGTATTTTSFVPYANPLTSQSPASAFAVTGCPSPLPFNWAQSSATVPTTGGATSAFTFTLSRADGQQYLEKTSVQLPPGLVGKIPAVAQCPEAQANAGGCPAASKVGTVTAYSGSGNPYPFGGSVYLTGPYQGAPYGLSIQVPVVAGPFNLGTEITRSKIEVNPNTARVTVNTPILPTIKGGIPVRLRTLIVAITAPNYILNPTNCGVLQTESLLTSTLGATENVSTPYQATGCSGLAFKPSFKATTTALTSKNNGASLETTLNQPGKEANIKSAVVTLPKAMPSRLTTLQKACPAATFNANPFKCPSGSYVGGARANTPVLPGKMTGPAVLVSHGGAAFPDLDLVLEANGVRVIVVGNTNIVKGITTTSFVTTPDVPVSSITVNLPTGPHSALGAVANFCTSSLVMPTTITGQNGKVFKQNTKIGVQKCPVQIIGHKVVGNEAVLTVETFSAGRISGSGKNLNTVARHLNSASKKATLRVPLSSGGKSKGRPFTANVRVGFVPKKKGPTSVAHVNVVFR